MHHPINKQYGYHNLGSITMCPKESLRIAVEKELSDRQQELRERAQKEQARNFQRMKLASQKK